MPFSAEVAERNEKRSKWIRKEGWHKVKVTGYRRTKNIRGGAVIFTFKHADGRQQTINFRLGDPYVRTGLLLDFVKDILDNWEYQGNPFAAAKTAVFKKLIGKEVAIWVEKTKRGLYEVLWTHRVKCRAVSPLGVESCLDHTGE